MSLTEAEVNQLNEQGLGSEERFCIHLLRAGELRLIATAPTPQALGLALLTLHQEGQLDGCKIGIRDAAERVWIIRPWSAQ